MSKVFKVLSIALLLISIVPMAARAQVQPKNPDVLVQGLYVQEPKVKEGSVIQGAFRLINQDAVPYSGIKYILVLSRYDSSHSPVEALDDKTFGPIVLKAKESKLVQFAYTLPRGVAGEDIGVRIMAVTESGYKMGWDDIQFQITGDVQSSLKLIDALIVINGAEFGLTEGPTAYPADTASYKATISNPTNAAVTLIPTVQFYKKDVTGKFMTKTTAPAVRIEAKSQGQFIFPLPVTFDPEVYMGKVSFSDEKGMVRVPFTTFRYIVGGDIVTIQSVSSAATSVQSGQLVDVKVGYTGTPVDIGSTTTQHAVGNALLSVKLFNEKNEPIGAAEQASEFTYAGDKTITIKAMSSARSLRAVVTVTKDGRTLGSSNAVLSLSEDVAPVKVVSYTDMLLAVFGFGIALVLFILWKLHKKNMPPSTPTPSGMPMAPLVVLALTLVTGLFAFTPTAHAFTVTSSHNENSTIFGPEAGKDVDWKPSLGVYFKDENKKAVSTMAPGQKFYVAARATINACQNRADNVGYQVKYLDNGSWKAMGTTTEGADTTRHGTTDYTDNLICDWGSKGSCVKEGEASLKGDAFVAPLTPGTYKIYFYVFNDPRINVQKYPQRGSAAFIPLNTDGDKWVDNEVNFGWVLGYQEFTVVDTTPRGEVRIESVDTNGNPYLAHRPRYISQAWGESAATYKSSPSFPPSKAIFGGLAAGSNYSTSLDVNFPSGQNGPMYQDIGIPNQASTQPVNSVVAFVSAGFKNILSFFGHSVSAQTVVGTAASCDRTIPTDIQVGVCVYDKNGSECVPQNFFNLQVRGLPSDPSCKADLYYPFDIQDNKVTKIVYKFGSVPVDPGNPPTDPGNPPTIDVSCKATVQIPTGGVEDPATQAGVNQSVMWTADVRNGTGPYTFTWTGTDITNPAGVMTADGAFVKSYERLGRKTVTLVVTDSKGASSAPQTCSVNGVLVKVNPVWKQF